MYVRAGRAQSQSLTAGVDRVGGVPLGQQADPQVFVQGGVVGEVRQAVAHTAITAGTSRVANSISAMNNASSAFGGLEAMTFR